MPTPSVVQLLIELAVWTAGMAALAAVGRPGLAVTLAVLVLAHLVFLYAVGERSLGN